MLNRIFPRAIDNGYRGHWPALWLFGLFIGVKLIMSVNSIVNTRQIATGADGIPLETYGADGAEAVLSLFALLAWGQLMLVLLGLIALARYRAMVPLMFLLLLTEHLGRRALLALHPIAGAEGPPIGLYINLALAAVLLIGFVLSILDARPRSEGGRR
ncbi:MAG: hypothetical protein ACT4OF_17140 [Caulobacteraceae bacterium]